ncbi:HOOK protein-domain-containing protein [Phycomyces nitens]|nr:HOOK protein-domain-containing protein [Phycomyces nitens]
MIEVFGEDPKKLPAVDLNKIAKDANFRELHNLCKLVLYVAVHCGRNQLYIEKIQMLSEEKQHALMIMHRMDSNGVHEQQSSMSSHNTPRSSYADDTHYQSQNELSKVISQKEKLEAAHEQLIRELANIRYRYDTLENEKEDLQQRLREMDQAVAQANKTGQADFIMRTEIEHLQRDLQRSEDRREELEMLMSTQSNTIEDLTRRGEELARQAERDARLKDQLDEYRHAAERLPKIESVMEKYKKKLEDSGDLRRQLKGLEDQNHSLMERNKQIEEEYRKVLAFKTLMDSYKDQVAALETKNNELLREKNKMEYEINQQSKKFETFELERQRDSDRIQLLEDHLEEAQLGANALDRALFPRGGEVANATDDMDLDEDTLGDSLEESLKESNVTELPHSKLSKRRLERQIKTLQEENASGRSQKAVVLQHLLDDANRLKSQFEKSYLEVSQERDILQSDMARIREGIPDALLDQSRHTLSLRLHIIDLEKESKSIREEVSKMESRVTDSRFNFSDGGDFDEFKVKYQEMEQRSLLLEEQTKKQLQDINKLLFEKGMLQTQSIEQKDLLLERERLNSEMKASLAAFGAKDDEPLKQQNAQLQQQATQVQEQLHEIQIKLRKAKEFIKQQDKMLKETKLGENSGDYNEAVVSLRAELSVRDEENDKLKKQIHEVRLQARREQQLIISAWYDVTRRTQKELASSKVNPNSWLGQQRRTLDNQLKRR